MDPRVDPSADANAAIRVSAEHGRVALVGRLLADARVNPAANDNAALKAACTNRHRWVAAALFAHPRVGGAIAADIAASPAEPSVARELLLSLLGGGAVPSMAAAMTPAAAQSDASGRLPLHVAVAQGAQADVLDVLLAAYPAAATTFTSDGKLPVHHVVPNSSGRLARARVAAVAAALLGGSAQPYGLWSFFLGRGLIVAVISNPFWAEHLPAVLTAARSAAARMAADVLIAGGEDRGSVAVVAAAAAARHMPWFADAAALPVAAATDVALAALAALPSAAAVRAVADLRDAAGRRAMDGAMPAVRRAIDARLLLFGRYEVGELAHRSATSVVHRAFDRSVTPRAPVALKFMRGREHYARERGVREEHGLSS